MAGIGSSISAANAAAAVPTTSVLAAATDEVPVQIAALFDAHAQGYQSLGAQAPMFHGEFVRALTAGAASCAAAVAANASPLQAIEDAVLGVIDAPTQVLFGRPLFGDGGSGTGDQAGANGTAGVEGFAGFAGLPGTPG